MDRNPFSSILCEGKLNIENVENEIQGLKCFLLSNLAIQVGLETSCSLPPTSDLDI